MKPRTTRGHKRFWRKRDDWERAYFTPEHPHRDLIIAALEGMRFGSVLEIGCGAGANLWRIKQRFPRAEIGGIDLNEKALEVAREKLGPLAHLDVGSAEKIFMSDKSADVVITDACLLYLGGRHFRKALKEIRRVARNNVVFCEWHSSRFKDKLAAWIRFGNFVHDYKGAMEDAGFYDIQPYNIPEKYWGNIWTDVGKIITAKT
jgi:ubiquinone/menaquinone biosynthesis C-methylase UbiE